MAQGLEYGAGTHVGLVRSNNEDAFLAEPDLGLWLIADGMGGHDAGEVASKIVKDSVYASTQRRQPLISAIEQSHNDVKTAASNNIGSHNMGTTIVALLTQKLEYSVAWVGDSRAYLWDPMTASLRQLSKDHSFVQALFDSGTITKEDMLTHPQKNVITQSLGIADLEDVCVDQVDGVWSQGQKILLCSDGLSDIVSDDEIITVFRKMANKSDQQIADTLIEVALDHGGNDNVTIAVISAPTNIHALTNPEKHLSKLFTGFLALAALGLGLFYFFK